MRNICLLLALLLLPYIGLAAFGVSNDLRGRIGIACVFLLTGMGHFFLAKPMSAMIPLQFPKRCRLPIIYITGIMELTGAVAVLIPSCCRLAGEILSIFLVLVLPTNIDSAIRRVPFGGHEHGPVYLLARVPLQILLIGWIYWFAIHSKS